MSVRGSAYDVAVVGGGLAGWIAATAALESGAHTALIERSPRPEGDGNSIVSGGALHANLRDPRTPPAELVETILRTTGGEASPAVAAAWANNAARVVEWIERHDGRLDTNPLHSHRAKVFSPVKRIVPGMHSEGYGTAQFLLSLARAFKARGGDIVQPARATGLGRAAPDRWCLELEDGSSLDARAIILADGGFQADPALLKRHVGTDRVKLRATQASVGDGLRMGLANGGVAIQMHGFYGHLLHQRAVDRDDLWPYPILDGLAGVGVVVGPDGRRIVDEGISGVRTTNAIAWSASPDACWLIFDDAAWSVEGRGGDTPPNPYLTDSGVPPESAPTLEALALRIGLDPRALSDELAPLFIDPGSADPPRRGRLCLRQPPFHAIPLIAGVSFTFGGLKIDGQAQLLDAADAPITGLYAAGGTAAGLHGGPDVGYAGGLLEAAVFGLIAGEQAGARFASA